MPDDAAFPALHARLGRTHSKVLVVAARFLDARIEDDEVVHELE
jgi:hypothetical protein